MMQQLFSFLTLAYFILALVGRSSGQLSGTNALEKEEEDLIVSRDLNRNITCLSCNAKEGPCDMEDVTVINNTIQDSTAALNRLRWKLRVVKKCHRCALAQTWEYRNSSEYGNPPPETPWNATGFYRHCLVTGNGSLGCTFDFPSPIKPNYTEVRQICRCQTNLCNTVSFLKMGGINDPTDFPPPPTYPRRKNVSSTLRLNILLNSPLFLLQFLLVSICKSLY